MIVSLNQIIYIKYKEENMKKAQEKIAEGTTIEEKRIDI